MKKSTISLLIILILVAGCRGDVLLDILSSTISLDGHPMPLIAGEIVAAFYDVLTIGRGVEGDSRQG